MDRNSIIGLLLIGAIMIGATLFNKTDSDTDIKKKTETLKKDSVTVAAKTNSTNKINSQPKFEIDSLSKEKNDSIFNEKLKLEFGDFALSAQSDSVKDISFETELFKGKIGCKGGTINNLVLNQYKTWELNPLSLLFKDSTNLNFTIPNGNIQVRSSDLYFKSLDKKSQYIVKGTDSLSFIIRAEGTNNKTIDYKYTLYGNSYKIGFSVILPSETSNKNIAVNWNQLSPRLEKNHQNEQNSSTIYYKDSENEVDKINPLASEKYTTEKALSWIGFKQQFFTSVLISESAIQTGAILETRASSSDSLNKYMQADFNIAVEPNSKNSLNFQFYFGPTHYATLNKVGFDLQKQIPLGWGIFGWVNKLIVIPAFNFLGQFNLGYGLVILLLTLYIKILLLAFQFKSYISQAKMRVLKPEMDELNEKYKDDDPLKKQQAVMELYRSAGVNPLGGCLPMLFQIPILFALFNFFPNAIELRQESFLWAEDLSTYDSIITLPFEIPFYGTHVSLFALLMTVSTIIYTRMNNQLSAGSSQMMPQLKWMMYLMPVIFLFVLNSYAAGLNYYYFLANIITFAQQFAFRKFIDDDKIHAKIQENKKKPKKSNTGSFQQRLEEMAKTRAEKNKK
ncbi:MAG TPA: membrane protein insertase YidC [Flavobacteriales bacterium]|nr:membrane protein insertase YidC [Flavobacteriales bacterium]